MGPRHGARAHGQMLADIAGQRRSSTPVVPSQMSRVTEALEDGRVRALLLFGTDLLSSYADSGRVKAALGKLDLVVSHDLFWNGTAREHADLVLPSTSWLEDLGCKSTNTHLYLMPKVLEPPGEARSVTRILRELARRLDLADFFPWSDESGPLDALLDHPSTGRATVQALSAEGGIWPLAISPVAYPDLAFDTPSGKVELVSERATASGPSCAAGLHAARAADRAAGAPERANADPLPRLLRPGPGLALAGPRRPRAGAVDLPGRRGGARDRRR